MILKDFGDVIRTLRNDKGLSQERFALKIKIDIVI